MKVNYNNINNNKDNNNNNNNNNNTPISSSGLRLDDEAARIAVGLRLGVDICKPHSCVYGELIDVSGSHALSCKRNNGRIIRHNYL